VFKQVAGRGDQSWLLENIGSVRSHGSPVRFHGKATTEVCVRTDRRAGGVSARDSGRSGRPREGAEGRLSGQELPSPAARPRPG